MGKLASFLEGGTIGMANMQQHIKSSNKICLQKGEAMKSAQVFEARRIEFMEFVRKSACHFLVGLLTIGLTFLLGAQMCSAKSWQIAGSIDLSSNVVQVLADPARPYVYAIDRANSEVLFIDVNTQSVIKRLYVGEDPTGCDIDATTNYLYVANKSVGTGLPGSYQIAVIDLQTQTKIDSYTIATVYIDGSLVDAINVTAGRNGRLYYNSGNDIWNFGAAGLIDTTSGTDLGLFAAIKTRMVISSDKTRLYGQDVYYGNLGEMRVFDVSTDTVQLLDDLQYPPYESNYGWGPDNYTLSGNDQYLAFGNVYFDAKSLSIQYGMFNEYIYAFNYDGTVAFGESAIWDPTTFAVHGNATKIQDLPFTSTVMNFDLAHNVLYLVNPADSKLYILAASSFILVPVSTNCSAAAASGSFTVEGDNSCCWTATEVQAWIRLTGAATGCGTGTVSYAMVANSTTNARSGTITVNGLSFTINQAGVGCSYAIAPTYDTFTASGGTGSVAVTAMDGCAWTATSNGTFITITTANGGTGNSTITFSVAANLSRNARTGTITVAGQTFTVMQAGIPSGPCPDLTGAWSDVVQSCTTKKNRLRCKIKGHLIVENIGTTNATTSVVMYYLSSDATFDAGDTLLKLQAMGTVKIGKPKKRTLSVQLPVGVTGSGQFIIAVIDPKNAVANCSTNDNVVVFGPLP